MTITSPGFGIYMSSEKGPPKKRSEDILSRLSWQPDADEHGASGRFSGVHYLDILDALPFYVLLVDQNHRILLANKAPREELKLEPHEIIGEYCPRVVHGLEHGTYPGCPLEEAVESQRPVEREYFDKKTGRWLKIAMYPTSAWTVDGERVYFHMLEDITKYKEAEEALKKLKKK